MYKYLLEYNLIIGVEMDIRALFIVGMVIIIVVAIIADHWREK